MLYGQILKTFNVCSLKCPSKYSWFVTQSLTILFVQILVRPPHKLYAYTACGAGKYLFFTIRMVAAGPMSVHLAFHLQSASFTKTSQCGRSSTHLKVLCGAAAFETPEINVLVPKALRGHMGKPYVLRLVSHNSQNLSIQLRSNGMFSCPIL